MLYFLLLTLKVNVLETEALVIAVDMLLFLI